MIQLLLMLSENEGGWDQSCITFYCYYFLNIKTHVEQKRCQMLTPYTYKVNGP